MMSILAACTLIFAACNNNAPKQESTETATTETPAAAPATPTTEEITLNAGDDMKFDKTEITVKAGSTVKLTLHHTGKSPKTGMGHNFVLLATGTNLTDFTTAAIAAKDNDYIPKDLQSSIIAHTKLLGGGESDTIEFPAPEKGTYTYICTFPGHFATMKGTLTVE